MKRLTRKSHPIISPGQSFLYLGRIMRVTTASRKFITAHYLNNAGNIQTITIPTAAAKTCIPTSTNPTDPETDSEPPNNDNNPQFIKLS